jgi:3-isopropylmalate dehydrogenase
VLQRSSIWDSCTPAKSASSVYVCACLRSTSSFRSSLPKNAFVTRSRRLNREDLNSRSTSPTCLVGIVPGEGTGPEVIDAACHVLEAVGLGCDLDFQVTVSGEIHGSSAARNSAHLSEATAEFCDDIFSNGGAIVAGAVGGRFVYETRRRFQLHYKLNPLRSYQELGKVCRIKVPKQPVDILVVRENLEDFYQGESVERFSDDVCEISHTFVHGEKRVRAVLEVAARAARERRSSLAVVGKESGLPVIHALWRRCALEAGEVFGVDISLFDIDYAAYKLLQDPESFDVIVAPNCFGDILSDLGGVLAGSRGLTFGASFSPNGAAVYQTNHGAAHDLAQTDKANPVGQIFSVAMMLRETFRLPIEAQLIEDAVRSVWRADWRTADLREPGCRIAGTQEFADLVAEEIDRTAVRDREACSAAG